MKIIRTTLAAMIGIVFFTAGCVTQTQGREPLPENKFFSSAQIEQLVAPIALYPDALIAQILIAATYPLEVIQAARWLRQNPGLTDDALENALQYQDWDASIKSLIKVPTILERMDKELNWTEDLGNAFLMQQDTIMDTVQTLRMRARSAGNLENTPYQEISEKDRIIYITPSRPNIIYVPEYNPTVVFANWSYPRIYYPTLFTPAPTIYWQEPERQTFGLITFGLGFMAGSILTNHIDWHRRNIIINEQHNYYHEQHIEYVNVTPFREWHHDPRHRHTIRYPRPLENNYRPEDSSRFLPKSAPLHSPPRIESAQPQIKEERHWRQTINAPIAKPFVTKEEMPRPNPIINNIPNNASNSPLATPFMDKESRNIIRSTPRIASPPLVTKEEMPRPNPVINNPPSNASNSPLATPFMDKESRNIIRATPRIASPPLVTKEEMPRSNPVINNLPSNANNSPLATPFIAKESRNIIRATPPIASPPLVTKEEMPRPNQVINNLPSNANNSPLATPFIAKESRNIIRATPPIASPPLVTKSRIESQASGDNKENILPNSRVAKESPSQKELSAPSPRVFSPQIYARQPLPDMQRSQPRQKFSLESDKPHISPLLRPIPNVSASRSESRKDRRNGN